MSIKKILVPVDFSSESEYALEAASEIAAQFDAEIIALHVIDVPAGSTRNANSLDILTNYNPTDDSDNLRQLFMIRLIEKTVADMEALKNKYPKAKITEKVLFDDLQKHINDFIKNQDCDLIVMGTKGDSGLHQTFVGSNTDKVIRFAHCPVLSIRERQVDFMPRSIVFASDFVDVPAYAIQTLKQFQSLFGATIHFVKVITREMFEITSQTHADIKNFAKNNGFDDFTVNAYNHYSEAKGIASFAAENKADMVAMTTHGRKSFSRFLFGSIAEELASQAYMPILTFNMSNMK